MREPTSLCLGEVDQPLGEEVDGVDRVEICRWSVYMRLQVQVWPGRVSAAADQADDLADSDGLSFVDRRPGDHVAVAGYRAVEVLDLDVPAFSAPDLGMPEKIDRTATVDQV